MPFFLIRKGGSVTPASENKVVRLLYQKRPMPFFLIRKGGSVTPASENKEV
jgi:hypothetical protein